MYIYIYIYIFYIYIYIYIYIYPTKCSQANNIRDQTQKNDKYLQFTRHVSDISLSTFSCYTKLLNGTH